MVRRRRAGGARGGLRVEVEKIGMVRAAPEIREGGPIGGGPC